MIRMKELIALCERQIKFMKDITEHMRMNVERARAGKKMLLYKRKGE